MEGMNLIEQAKLFATQKHVLDNKQLYGQIVPYTHHLEYAERVLVKFYGNDETLQTVMWLHDVIEDTRGRKNEVKLRDIEELFGDDVAVIVNALTCEPGDNRKARNLATYPKIRAAGEKAIVCKLADRIANLEFGGKMSKKYKQEYPEFKYGLGFTGDWTTVTGAQAAMWNHLEKMMENS